MARMAHPAYDRSPSKGDPQTCSPGNSRRECEDAATIGKAPYQPAGCPACPARRADERASALSMPIRFSRARFGPSLGILWVPNPSPPSARLLGLAHPAIYCSGHPSVSGWECALIPRPRTKQVLLRLGALAVSSGAPLYGLEGLGGQTMDERSCCLRRTTEHLSSPLITSHHSPSHRRLDIRLTSLAAATSAYLSRGGPRLVHAATFVSIKPSINETLQTFQLPDPTRHQTTWRPRRRRPPPQCQ